MTEPIRWLDDPAFRVRTGVRIEDDDALLQTYNLDDMAARLGEAFSGSSAQGNKSADTGASTGTGTGSVGAGSLSAPGAVGAKGFFLLGVTTALVTVGVGALLAPSIGEHRGHHEDIEISTELQSPAQLAFTLSQRAAPMEVPPPDATVQPTPSPRGSMLTTNPSPTTLAAEIALYKQGAAALQAGDADDALGVFRRYQARYPNGTLRGEAMLSEFEALVGLGQDDAAIEIALAIVSNVELRTRWDEVMKTLSGIAKRADRCDEVQARLKLRKLSKRALVRFVKGCD